MSGPYDPFARGRYPVGVQTIQAIDSARAREFPCEIWYPATAANAGRDLEPRSQDVFTVPQMGTRRSQSAVRDAEVDKAIEPGARPLVVFSHSSGGGRRQSTFDWDRDVPTLYLVAEDDVSLPLAGMVELLERTPASRQMIGLCRADHTHFMDDVERLHEAVRSMPFAGELAWLPREMRPIDALCTGEHAELFVRGMTLCHLDATIREHQRAREILGDDIRARLARRGVAVVVHPPGHPA
jgi:predicted dienelactone hydrolase